jgi:transmembrane sensor
VKEASGTEGFIERQAAAWLVRRADSALPSAGEREFRRWLKADVRHEEAFRSLERTWGDVADLKHLESLAPLDSPAPARGRRFVLAAAAAAAVVCVAVFAFLQFRTGESFRTATAEMRTFVLKDGSEVTLGAKSSLQVLFRADKRRIVLTEGEGFFRVARDPARPFVVEAGDATVRVLGTEFDVRHGGGAVRVSVLEGVVEVGARGENAGAAAHQLSMGEHAEILSSGVNMLSPPPGVPGFPDMAAWRFGRLVYENAPLGQLVADANRYYGPGIELVGAGLENLRITAAFRTGETAETVMVLARVLSLSAARRPDGHIVLSR